MGYFFHWRTHIFQDGETAQQLLVSANEQLAKTDRKRHETQRTKPGDP